MSLIADSLKNALKDKPPGQEETTNINLISRDVFRTKSGFMILKIFFLIVVPAVILGYLIYAGAFDPRRTKVTELPVFSKDGGAAEEEKKTRPLPATIALPLEIEVAPVGDNVSQPKPATPPPEKKKSL